MLNGSDVIIKSKDEAIFQTSTASMKMFNIHEQVNVKKVYSSSELSI